MKRQIVSWGLVLSLFISLLPVSAMATEDTLSENSHPAAGMAQCTCGAQPDEAGTIVHAETCPLFSPPQAPGEEPAAEPDGSTPEPDDSVTEPETPSTEPDNPVTKPEEPAGGAEEPVEGTEEPAQGTEESVEGTEEPAQGTEEPAVETLTPPALTCEPLDEFSSSDMVLTVEGAWDSYAWEVCAYGSWSDWAGDGPNLTLSKEEFTSYGFRCTVTLGEQSVTSEVFAYDPSVLERPMVMANDLSDDPLYGSSDYIKFGKRLPNSTMFDIKGLDNGYEIQTTYANAGYRAAISVDGGTKMTVFYRGEPISVGSSLTAETSLEIVYGGRYVKVTYEVTNNGSTTQNFRIGSSADVMIGSNDYAEVVGVKSSTGKYTGLTMSGSPKNNYQFSLVAPDCDTLWYGYYSKAFINIFNNLSDKDSPYSKDSGMAWSWNDSVAPGQTWSRYVLIGAGNLPPAPSTPTLSADSPTSWTTGTTVTVTGTATGSPAADTVYVNFGGTDYTGTVQNDGTFSIEIPVPENSTVGPSSFTYWGTSNDGGISEIKTQNVSIIAGPSIHLAANNITVMEDDTVNEIWLRNFIKSSYGTVTINPSSIDTSTPGTTTVTYTAKIENFEDKTAVLTVNVLPKPAALTVTSVAKNSNDFTLTATMEYTGGLDYEETGFVYGTLQNPTLTLNDGKVTTTPTVNSKNGTLSAAISKDKLVYGVNYYARAYAKTSDGTVIYGAQSTYFGVGAANYGTFSVTNSGNTFTITRTGGTDGEQTVYYRTVNGSAIGGTHFEHQAGSVTFKAGETSKSIPITEMDVASIYNSNAATAYSNADRTYSLEIYRVVGGATIDSSQKSATRTMTVNDSYHVSDDIFTGKSTVVKSGETERGDAEKDNMGWTATSEGNTANSKETVDITAVLPNRDYWRNLPGAKIWYRVSFEAWETEDGYQHIQVNPGESLDLSIVPNEGSYSTESPRTAVYAATFEHKSGDKDTNSRTYSFPITTDHPIPTGSSLRKQIFFNGSQDGKILLSTTETHVSLGFNGSGSGSDKWKTRDVTHYLGIYDAQEPQLLGVAPMAGGSYLPGDSVTVALVFDEIVDNANSMAVGLGSGSTITTNWGTFTYAGGADTNVLYFTGTVPTDASGTIALTNLDCASQIKDMCDTQGTVSSGSGSADVTLGTGDNAPTVTVSDITNDNGTLTGTITAANAGKLEYAWSTETNKDNVIGWKLLTNPSSATVTTRQTSGTWYLYARATNNDGVTAYGSQSVSLGEEGSGKVQLPSLTVAANNTDWARSRQIMVTRSPSNATVTVTLPDGGKVQNVGDTYTATTNGTYTFTLESGGETVTQMVTVSKIDATAPTVEIVDLANTNHIEPVTLTVRVSDGASGIKTVTGTWRNSNDGSSQSADISSENGVYIATSPNAGGTWTLTVTAADNAGNTASDISAAYTVNLDEPTVSVMKQPDTSSGVTYNYIITPGGSDIAAVQLPEGFELPDGITLPTSELITGSLTLTAPGIYYITVTDAAGHVVTSDPMEVAGTEAVDATPPEVRLSADSNGAASLTINVSVFEEGSALQNVDVALPGGGSQTIALTPDGDDGVYTGTFTVTTAGTYIVTATDTENNIGTTAITAYSVTFNGDSISVPAQLVVSGDKATKPADPTRVGYTFDGWYNGDAAYTFGAAVTGNLTLTAQWSAIPATAPTVTENDNLTQAYGSSDGAVSVAATAAGDTTYTIRYQWYRNATNSTIGGTAITEATGSSYTIPSDTAVGTYYYYCKITAERVDNGKTATAISGVIMVTINKAAQTAPDSGIGYTIDYIAEAINIEDGYEVFTAQDSGTEIENGGSIIPGATVYIRKQGSDTHEPSDWTPINIPARPAAPIGITKTDETIKGKADGTVSGITTAMEYHTGDGDWKPGTGEILTDLPAGTTVTVRYPASETAFASVKTEITIMSSNETLAVTFLENGGTDAADKTGLSYGEKITAPTISRTGYTLEGWYNDGKLWDFETDLVKKDITLEARWTLDIYAITYDLDGGSLADGVSNPESYTVETESFSLSNPTKPGYTFVGWTGSNGTTPQPTVTITKGTTGNKVYTAHWTMGSFTVTLNASKPEVTYGEEITLAATPNHGATDVTYTYQWYKDGNSTPLAGESEATLTLTDVSDSGKYQVEVTASDDTQNQTVSSNDVTVTILQKPIFVTWSGLYQTYGDTETEAVATPSSVLDGDIVTALVSGEGETAGNHDLTATLTGDDAHNYALQNSTAILHIQPKPVIFTVTGNAVQADGEGKSVTVTPDDAACTYTVIYRQDGKEITSPTDAGEYEIWVKITDANYRHTNGSDTMQVGILTITPAPPVVYTVSFAGGEDATGDEPAPQTTVAGGQITLPTNPFNKTVGATRYRFTGWKAKGDSKLYQPGDVYAMPNRDVTFTAQWEAVFAVSGGVTEKNPDGTTGGTVGGAVVSLWLGANKIGETMTDSTGVYHFDNLVPGIYNLVVTKDVRTVTSMVTITDTDRVQDASLPAYVTNSVVEVAPGSPNIVVGQLDQAFADSDQETAQSGGKVELTFTAEEKQLDDVDVADDLTKIDEKAPDNVNLALTMDYTITKTVTTVSSEGVESTTTESISQAHALLEILLPMPTQLQGKYIYSVYRVHSSTGNAEDKVAQELKQGEANRNELGEYFTVNSDKTALTLHVKCFSTYAIGYSDVPVTPTPPDGNSGGSYTPTYPPKVEQPEHGSVTTSPKNPGEGDKVTITPTPEDGYTVDQVTVTGPDGQPVDVVTNDDGTYTFVQPAEKVTVVVTFRQITDVSACPRDGSCPMAAFTDTNIDAWYHDGVHYCLENGLMNGTTTTTFGPNIRTSRAMLATILYRMEGSPDVASSFFSDVKSGAYYADAVAWASSNGIVTGYSDGTFLPNKAITREEMAAMLWRYAGSPEADGSIDSFADGAQTGSWVQPAMIWAVEQGLITGTDNGRLNPQGVATRAEIATILMRLAQTMAQ